MLRVRLLGELELELEGVRLEPPVSRRARSLLGLLALDHRQHPRPQLAARFWPDVLDDSARTSLRSALTAVRRALGPDADRYLLATRERAGLSDQVATDVAEFDALRATGRLEEAMELWRGDLLAGLDDDWVLVARDEWREHAAAVLSQLAEHAEADGDLAKAIGHTRRIVALDPLAEDGQRALMRRLTASGDRAAALIAYNRYADRLRAELRVAPSAATRALADELRAPDTADLATTAPASSAAVASAQASTPPTTAPRGASGTMTLLFTDLVGSTELLDDLGDEEAERLRRIHFALLRDVALSHAGQEVKNLGDGLMVAFGSSVDASACAIGIQQTVDRHNRREHASQMGVRVGLHVGEPIRDEGDYFGTAVVVAKRLCDRAEGGQILASELVRQLIGTRGEFEFKPIGALMLKGFSTPVETCELSWKPVGERGLPLPAELTQGQETFVGRRAELDAVSQAWAQARDGELGVVLVAGEPGIGKTRLVSELCRQAHSAGAAVLLGHCTEDPLAPYQPFVEALQHYVNACPADELLLQIGTRRAVLGKLVPELVGGQAPPDGDRDETRGAGERFALFDAVASLLGEAARSRPLILVLDDLHWADPPSVSLLRHVVRAAAGSPLLILGTYREIEVDDEHPLAAALAELRRARALTTLTLTGLGDDDVAALIRERGGQLDDELIHAVAERTEGNPFFVEEVLRHVGGGLGFSLPPSVQDLLLRRLRRLDEAARRTLAAAAVLGTEFELAVLERMLSADADELLEIMELALRETVLIESRDAVGRYTFAHALIRETIDDQLSATRRARLHLRAGEAIEATHADHLDEYAEQLAHHFVAAGDEPKSFEYLRRAARAAARVHAAQAAMAHYDAAIDIGRRLGHTPEADESMRRMLVERGFLRHIWGDPDAGLVDYEQALEGARAAGDRRLEAEALDGLGYVDKLADAESSEVRQRAALRIAEDLGDEALQVRILNRLSLLLSNQLDLAGARQLGERALELAGHDDQGRAMALDALKLVALQLGETDELQSLTSELERIERRRGELWYLQFSLFESAFAPLGRAQWEVALSRLAEALSVNARIDDPLARPLIHDAVGWLERSRGNYERALAEGRAAAALTAPGGRGRWTSWTHATLGWTLLELRAAEPAIEVLEHAMKFSELRSDRLRAAGHLAWARALVDDIPGFRAAAAIADEDLARLRAPTDGTFLFGFGAVVALARAALRAGDAERVPGLLAPTLTAAQRWGWHEAAASASLVLGLADQAGGDDDAAREALSRAIELSAKHELPGIEWEARAALAGVAGDEEASRLRAESDAIVERLARAVGDERLAGDFVRRVKG